MGEKWNQIKNNGASPLEMVLLNALAKFTLTVEQGASTQVFLAAGADGNLQKGAFYEDCKVQNLRPFAIDPPKAKQLWEISENLGGVEFKLGEKKTVASAETIADDKDESIESS